MGDVSEAHALNPESSSGGSAPAAVKTAPARATNAKPRKRKASKFWLKQLHTWHWISAAISLVGMMLFAVTGITLNHAASIAGTPKVVDTAATMPAQLMGTLRHTPPSPSAPVPAEVAARVKALVGLDIKGRAAEWSDDEVYVAMPGPGTDAWVSIDRKSGAVSAEKTDRGWISYFNDLHKGRNSGAAWSWFIDLFAIACVVFTITGLLLLQLHARARPSTWPLVGFGLAIPLIIALFFLH